MRLKHPMDWQRAAEHIGEIKRLRAELIELRALLARIVEDRYHRGLLARHLDEAEQRLAEAGHWPEDAA